MGRHVKNFEDLDTLLQRVSIDPVTKCWLWTGQIQTLGYGQIEIAGRIWLSHRLSWALHQRTDPTARLEPPEQLVLHSCDTPACVNPEHLFLGDHKTNHEDAVSKGRVDPMRISRHSKGPRTRKLTDAQVIEIRSKADTVIGYSRRFKVSRSVVYDIQAGRTKRHLL